MGSKDQELMNLGWMAELEELEDVIATLVQGPEVRMFWVIEHCKHCGAKTRRNVSHEELLNSFHDKKHREIEGKLNLGQLEFYRSTRVPCEDCVRKPERPSRLIPKTVTITGFDKAHRDIPVMKLEMLAAERKVVLQGTRAKWSVGSCVVTDRLPE